MNRTNARRALRAAGVVYIVLIGIFAIEELNRRDKFLSALAAREVEVGAALTALVHAQGDGVEDQRKALEYERAKLASLKARTTALVLVDAIRPEHGPPQTLKMLACEYAQIRSPDLRCESPAEPAPFWTADFWKKLSGREVAATFVLKRTVEQRSSGDVFAVLVVIAALGGALIRMYLPNEPEDDTFRTVLRSFGGGVVCYLVLTGGGVLFQGANMTAYASPATGALIGLLCGMFSTKVFQLLAVLVESWVDKLTPRRQVSPPGEAAPATNGAPAVVRASAPPAAAVHE